MEEDIKILEELKECFIFNTSGFLDKTREEQKRTAYAINNILKRYKELEEKIEKQELVFVNGYMEGGNNQDNIWRAKIQNKLEQNKAKTDCRYCNNACDSYGVCIVLKELLKE